MGLLKNCVSIVVIRNKANLGVPKAFNQGLKIVLSKEGDYFLILNNDVTFYEQTIDELLQAIENSEYKYITALDRSRNWDKVSNSRNKFWEGLCNSCFITSRKFWDVVGLYDENYGLGNTEDRDLLHRASLLGLEAKCWIPALIEHKHGHTQSLIGSNTSDKLMRNKEYMENKFKIKLGW